MLIIKWAKGWFKALGFHHALIALVCFISYEIIGSYFTVASMISVYFLMKELRENGDKIEILDILTVTILSFSYATYRTFVT